MLFGASLISLFLSQLVCEIVAAQRRAHPDTAPRKVEVFALRKLRPRISGRSRLGQVSCYDRPVVTLDTALVFTAQDVVLQQVMEVSIRRRRGDNFRRVTWIVTFGLDSPGYRA